LTPGRVVAEADVVRIGRTDMIRWLRLAGVAFGSFVAASLIVGLVLGVTLGMFGIQTSIFLPGLDSEGSAIRLIATLVLGALIYRDILRRDLPIDRSAGR
jgi:hypothetical protein